MRGCWQRSTRRCQKLQLAKRQAGEMGVRSGQGSAGRGEKAGAGAGAGAGGRAGAHVHVLAQALDLVGPLHVLVKHLQSWNRWEGEH